MACVDALGLTLQICVAMLRAAKPVCDDGRPLRAHARVYPVLRDEMPRCTSGTLTDVPQ